MPSVCTPAALQVVDQLTSLSSKFLAQAISHAPSTCFLPQRDACRDFVLGQGTLLDSLSLVMMDLAGRQRPSTGACRHARALPCAPDTVAFPSAASKSSAARARFPLGNQLLDLLFGVLAYGAELLRCTLRLCL